MKRWSHANRLKKKEKSELTPEEQFNHVVDGLARLWDKPSSAEVKLFVRMTDPDLYARVETAVRGRQAEKAAKRSKK